MKYALINSQTNVVENIIEWDESNDWVPTSGYFIQKADSVEIGDTYNIDENVFLKRNTI